MAIKTLLKLNGEDFTGMILTPFKIGRPKLWGDDTGRLMSGEMTGTLKGIFPKLTVIFAPKNESDLEKLCNILDTAWQTIEYYNPIQHKVVQLGTYTNDYEVSIINAVPFFDDVTVSFIATKREVKT